MLLMLLGTDVPHASRCEHFQRQSFLRGGNGGGAGNEEKSKLSGMFFLSFSGGTASRPSQSSGLRCWNESSPNSSFSYGGGSGMKVDWTSDAPQRCRDVFGASGLA